MLSDPLSVFDTILSTRDALSTVIVTFIVTTVTYNRPLELATLCAAPGLSVYWSKSQRVVNIDQFSLCFCWQLWWIVLVIPEYMNAASTK